MAAIDLGASSGRVMVGVVGPGRLELHEVHRFPNGPVTAPDRTLRWPLTRLLDEVLAGLSAAGPVDSVGVDTWAVDYGLLDASGRLLDDPFSYRDRRGERGVAVVDALTDPAARYALTGTQHLPFNTLFQLAAETRLDAAAALLLIPDLIAWRLTGTVGAEATNASTTALYDPTRRAWATDLARDAGIPPDILPPLREPGEVLGTLLPEVCDRTGLRPGTPLVAVGSHDTASAVVAVPMASENSAYISAGTWSLVGLELGVPVLTEAARAANFTNEVGVDGTVRFLRNVAGLWVLSQAMEVWGENDVAALVAAAAAVPSGGAVVDLDAPEFVPPGDMETRIRAACAGTGQAPPRERAAVVRCVLDSLALAHRRAVREAAGLADRDVDVVHLVGGGARGALLGRLTADACGLPVEAGPVEATALGNVLVQARALGVDLPGLGEMRALVRETQPVVRYDPADDGTRWDAAEHRLPSRADVASPAVTSSGGG
ncbi:MAG: rhamnulokinase [Phycicoccus sp.]